MLSPMARWTRRIILLLLIAAAVAALRRTFTVRRMEPTMGTPSPQWPPFEPAPAVTEPAPTQPVPTEPAPTGPTPTEPVATDPVPAWVEAVDGECPDGYPIKAKTKSRIYHVPEGQFYARTVPERCYATAEAAEQDGYRQAKA
jgi:hypothetical protein